MIASSFGTIILGPRIHMTTIFIWQMWRILEAVDGHCGYDFPWNPFRVIPIQNSSSYHDYHHHHNIGNFGSLFGIWDTILGTNKSYKKFKSTEENKIK